MTIKGLLRPFLGILVASFVGTSAIAGQTNIAVAANFTDAA